MSEADVLLLTLGAELEAAVQRTQAGFDIAPSRRARLETLAGTALMLGIDEQELLAFCRQRLPADAGMEVSGNAVRIDIWQRRAPVEPTTSSC